MKKILTTIIVVLSTVSSIQAGETKTVSKDFYIETANSIQKLACYDGEMTLLWEIPKCNYVVIDGELVEYRYSLENGLIVTVKTIVG